MALTIFRNAAIFDGHSPHLMEDHSVIVDDGRIVEVTAGEPKVRAEIVIDAGGRTLMPGLIDLHAHPALADVVAPRAVLLRTEIVALQAARTLRKALMSGFTTLRDAGGADPIFRKAIDMGLIDGPRLFPSGRFLTMTGGHGDMSDPEHIGHTSCWGQLQDRFVAVVDGADAVRKGVREELRRGATQIKLLMSGGVLSPTGNLHNTQFTQEEVRSAVTEAEAQGRYVLAHCHADQAIRCAAQWGVRSIEHCTFITEETAAIVAGCNAYAVPTLAVAKALEKHGDEVGLPVASQEKLEGVYLAMLNSISLLKAAGVKIGFGTDVCGEHTIYRSSEFRLRSEVLTPHEILVSATSMAAEIMMQAGQIGTIAPGALADIILVDGNPLDDIGVLDSHANDKIAAVMKAGRMYKMTF